MDPLTRRFCQRIEQKRLEHERQRLIQRQHFEEQMRALELQQQQEERALLTPSSENPLGSQHVALSAPSTPPRGSAALANGEALSTGGISGLSFLHHQAVTNGIPEEFKRHSANYGSLVSQPREPGNNLAPGSHNHAAGAKSMPGSRRGSSGSSEAAQDMVASLNLGSLSIQDKQIPRINGVHPLRSATNPEVFKANAASLFDEDLDNEMSSECLCYVNV